MNGTPAEAQVQNMTALTISSRSTIHLARLARRADPVHCRMPDEVMCRVWGLQTIGSQWRLFVTVAVLLSDTEDAALGWADWLDGEGWEGLQLVSSVKVREPIPIRIRFILLVAYQSLLRIFVRVILQTVPLCEDGLPYPCCTILFLFYILVVSHRSFPTSLVLHPSRGTEADGDFIPLPLFPSHSASDYLQSRSSYLSGPFTPPLNAALVLPLRPWNESP